MRAQNLQFRSFRLNVIFFFFKLQISSAFMHFDFWILILLYSRLFLHKIPLKLLMRTTHVCWNAFRMFEYFKMRDSSVILCAIFILSCHLLSAECDRVIVFNEASLFNSINCDQLSYRFWFIWNVNVIRLVHCSIQKYARLFCFQFYVCSTYYLAFIYCAHCAPNVLVNYNRKYTFGKANFFRIQCEFATPIIIIKKNGVVFLFSSDITHFYTCVYAYYNTLQISSTKKERKISKKTREKKTTNGNKHAFILLSSRYSIDGQWVDNIYSHHNIAVSFNTFLNLVYGNDKLSEMKNEIRWFTKCIVHHNICPLFTILFHSWNHMFFCSCSSHRFSLSTTLSFIVYLSRDVHSSHETNIFFHL